jgi:hypothetical protein
MLWSQLSVLQSRVTEYPGYASLHSDAIAFHETAAGEHNTSRFLVTQTWVTGEAFQSMISDFEDIDRIRHELDMVTTTTTDDEYITLTKNSSASFNTAPPTAPPSITSGTGTGFYGFPLDHHSTHTAESSYIQPSTTGDADSGASSAVAGFSLGGCIQLWILLSLGFGLVLLW